MTDLLNGKIDFFGFEVNPGTTLEAFDQAIGNKFSKEAHINERNNHLLTTYYLNKKTAVLNDFRENDTRFVYELYGMNFLNVVIDFSDNKIWQIKLITNMGSSYNKEKEDLRYKILNDWTVQNWGDPTYSSNSAIWYDTKWGRIKPSTWGDSGNSKLYITFNR